MKNVCKRFWRAIFRSVPDEPHNPIFITPPDVVFALSIQYFLFDLDKDPHETTNLYASTEAEHEAAKVCVDFIARWRLTPGIDTSLNVRQAELYALVEMYRANARQEPKLLHSKRAKAAWTSADFNILPWANLSTEINAISKGKVGPKLCIP